MLHAPRMRRASRAVRVGPTPYGRGVFARRQFHWSEVVGEIQGTVITDPEYGSDYCMEFGNSLVLEPSAPFRYLNHSCQPNCKLVCLVDWNERTSAVRRILSLTSLASIGPGEQLTIDYAWPADCAIPCACGSPDCRGWIVAQDELDDLLAAQPSRKSIDPDVFLRTQSLRAATAGRRG